MSGAEIALVVKVLAVGDVLKPQVSTLFFEDCEQLVFAMEAATSIITCVLWSIHLLSRDNFQWNAPMLREFNRQLQFVARQTGRIRQNRERFLSEHLVP